MAFEQYFDKPFNQWDDADWHKYIVLSSGDQSDPEYQKVVNDNLQKNVYTADKGYTQLTPEQVQQYQAASMGGNPNALAQQWEMNQRLGFTNYGPLDDAGNPIDQGATPGWRRPGIYNDSASGGSNMWFGPNTDHNNENSFDDFAGNATIAAMALMTGGAAGEAGAAGAGAGGGGGGGGAAATAGETGAYDMGQFTAADMGAGSASTGGGGAGAAGTGTAATGTVASQAGDASGGASNSGSTGSTQTTNSSQGSNMGDETDFGYDPGAEGTYQTPTTPDSTIYPNGIGANDPSVLNDLVNKYGKDVGMQIFKQLMSSRGAGGLLAAGIGAIGANRTAGALSGLAARYEGYGAPSRARYESSFAPGFTMMNDPGYKDALDMTAKATLHGLSVSGNPAGSPNAWDKTLSDVNAKFAYPALQAYRTGNANTGGIGTLTAAAPGAATGAITARGDVLNAAGGAVNDIFNPPRSLADQLMEYERMRRAA